MIGVPWFKKIGKAMRRLSAPPYIVAASLHQMAERPDPQVAPEALYLPEAIHARFRQKLLLYREANILLALFNQVKPSRDGGRGDQRFKQVFSEYERIIYAESAKTPDDARRQSVKAAIKDLNANMHLPMGNKFDLARDWSRNWFADIGYNEINPEILSHFSLYWFDEYAAARKALEADW